MGQPHIVVLDGHTVNPGDLDWEPLGALGLLTVHPRTAPEQVRGRIGDAAVVLTNKVLLRELELAAPQLHYVGILATGTNAVDLGAARARNITVCNVPAYSTDSVAQLVIENLLDAATSAAAHRAAVAQGHWETSEDFSFNVTTVQELRGQVLGVIGYGSIGSQVARVAQALGMTVLVANSSSLSPRPLASGLQRVALPELFCRSDFVTLHCPLNDRTRGLIGENALATMKPSAYLINSARGPLLDEAAVARALDTGRLQGAYLDVLSQEPPAANNPLLHHPRCKITPHIAWTSLQARQRLISVSADNVAAFLRGAPQNVVS